MRIEINNQQVPLYFMGTDALEAERAALQQRKTDDFTEGHIAQIARELQLLSLCSRIHELQLSSLCAAAIEARGLTACALQ